MASKSLNAEFKKEVKKKEELLPKQANRKQVQQKQNILQVETSLKPDFSKQSKPGKLNVQTKLTKIIPQIKTLKKDKNREVKLRNTTKTISQTKAKSYQAEPVKKQVSKVKITNKPSKPLSRKLAVSPKKIENSLSAAAEKRRVKIEGLVAALSKNISEPVIKKGDKLMSTVERRRELLRLAEEMAFIHADSLSR